MIDLPTLIIGLFTSLILFLWGVLIVINSISKADPKRARLGFIIIGISMGSILAIFVISLCLIRT